MAERKWYAPSEVTRRKLTAIVAAPLLAGCGGSSVADLDQPAPPRSEFVHFRCTTGQAGEVTTQQVPYHVGRGKPFDIRIVDAEREKKRGEQSAGVPITVYPERLQLSRGSGEARRGVTVVLHNVSVSLYAEPHAVAVTGTCIQNQNS